MAATPRKTAKKSKKTPAKAVVTKNEKEALVKDLKETTKQLGRLPRLMLAPIIGFIAKKYDAIPENRRKQLQKITKDIKENGASAVDSLKNRFQSLMRHDKKAATSTTKKARTKKTTAKKTTPKKTATKKKIVKKPVKRTTKKTSATKKTTT